MRKLMSVVATAAMLGLGLTSVAPAPVHADGADRYGKSCNPQKYREHYKVTNRTVKPEVTYQKSYQLAPGERWKTSKQIDLQRQVTVKAKASFSYKGGGSVSLPGKLLGELKAETGLSFQASGTANRTKVVKTREERSFRNPDDRNRKVVFYRGVTRATGSFTRYACYQKYLPGQSYGPYKVHIYDGTFQTWTDHAGLSHLLCGRASTGALAKMVAKQYCPL